MSELREKMAEFGYLPEGSADDAGEGAGGEDVDFADAVGAAEEEA